MHLNFVCSIFQFIFFTYGLSCKEHDTQILGLKCWKTVEECRVTESIRLPFKELLWLLCPTRKFFGFPQRDKCTTQCQRKRWTKNKSPCLKPWNTNTVFPQQICKYIDQHFFPNINQAHKHQCRLIHLLHMDPNCPQSCGSSSAWKCWLEVVEGISPAYQIRLSQTTYPLKSADNIQEPHLLFVSWFKINTQLYLFHWQLQYATSQQVATWSNPLIVALELSQQKE